MSQEKTLYEVLGVPATADPGQIEAAYKEKLAQLVEHSSVGEQATLHQIEELKEAHEILLDPSRRARYERDLQQSRQFYQTLGLSLTATPNEVNAAYQDSIIRVVTDDDLDWTQKQSRIEAIKAAYRAIMSMEPHEVAEFPSASRFQFSDLEVSSANSPPFARALHKPSAPDRPEANALSEQPSIKYRGWMLVPIFGLMLIFFLGLNAILGLFSAPRYGSLWSIVYSFLLVALLAVDSITLYLIYLQDRRAPLCMIGTYWLAELIMAAGLVRFWEQYHSWETYPLWRLKLFGLATITVIVITDYLLRSQRVRDTFERHPDNQQQPPLKA